MIVSRVLVVCLGNICRSPVGERLLAQRLPGLEVTSVGIAAVIGASVDATAAAVAQQHGLSTDGHIARQFTPELGAAVDLILAMEPGHRREIARLAPHLSGRTLLFDQWTGGQGIPDPYRRPQVVHEATFALIAAAAAAWAARLSPKE